jgi:hypothetical protein
MSGLRGDDAALTRMTTMAGSYGVYGRNSRAWRNHAEMRGWMPIIINDDPAYTTWAEFKKANRDGFTKAEFAEIARMERDGVYHGGGGAFAEFTIRCRGLDGVGELMGWSQPTKPGPSPKVRPARPPQP